MSTTKTNHAVNPPKAGWQSDASLIALALMWGTSHVITKEILASHSPAFYTSVRFGIAALCFALFFAGHLQRSNRRKIKQGILLGLLSFTGIAFYVLGLNFTQASKAGFITGLYLVFTPLLSYVLFRVQPTQDHIAGLVIAIAGFTLLSFPHGGQGINWGDMLVFMAAIAWAAHIVATSAFATDGDVRTLAAMQVITVAVLSIGVYLTLRTMGMETRPNPVDAHFLRQILYMAVMVTFVAALVQTWAQGRVNPTHAVLFYALEPVTAAVYAYIKFGEKLSLWGAIGAVLIVAGVMVSRLRLTSRLTGSDPINSMPIEVDC